METPKDLLVAELAHILKGKEISESVPKIMILKNSLVHMTKFAMVFRCYCHTYPSQFPRNPRLFFVAISTNQVLWKQR
jgi:hypothetical protein